MSTFRNTPGLGNNDVWLGASDLETRGVFRWVTGKPLSWLTFKNNKPAVNFTSSI